MGSTRDSLQAGPRPEIPVIAPNASPLSHTQALARVAPRSSSLPILLMGHSPSKQAQHNSPAPSLASRSFTTAISLKRAFAARRKKSDVDKPREQDADSRSVVGSFTFPRNRVEITASSASSPPQVLLSSPISSPHPSQSRSAKEHLSQLASHVFTPKKQHSTQKPLAITTNVDSSSRPLPPPPLPPKQLSVSDSVPSPVTAPTTMSFARSHGPTLLHPPPASLEQNRSSIIPMSPPIQPAISYLTMSEQLHRQEQEVVVPLTSRHPQPLPTSTSSSQPIAPVSSSLSPPSSTSTSLLPPSANPVQTPPPPTITTTTTTTSSASASSTSEPAVASQAIPGKPLIRGTPLPDKLEDHLLQIEDTKRVERPTRPRSDSDGALLEREYADKRKSDSTISHYTIRPGAGTGTGGASRSSRPVSMADSIQSSYTIVPGVIGSAGGVVNVVLNKRLSAVDPDYSLLEEDDGDSFKSLDDEDEDEDEHNDDNNEAVDESVDGGGHDKRGSAVWVRAGGNEDKVTPPNSLLRQKRRSMSLNVSSTSSKVHLPYPPPPPTASATELKHPSYSISEGFYSQTPSSSSSSSIGTGTSGCGGGGRLQPNRNQKLPAIPPQTPHNGANAHMNTTFTYPTQRPLPNHPAPPPSFRQTAVSITSSLAPAAGLAKKAVEKFRGALNHMGSSPSSHGHGHGHHHHHHAGSHSGSISSASISSGYSSSISTSSTAPSSFLPGSTVGAGGNLSLARTPSNQSSAATQHSTSTNAMHVVNIGGIKERNERERQQQQQQFGKKKKGKGMKRTGCRYGGSSGGGSHGGSGSISNSMTTSTGGSGSDPDAFMMPSGPLLGVQLRGPMTSRHGVPVTGGVVFGRALGKCVRETAVWIGKDPARVMAREDGRELMGRLELKVYERRMLPAIVVRCAQHLLIWGVQEEGLFRVPGRAAHIARLKSEFDTGVDYDMSGCTPGDLDPHAVASIFKAYLRELPEHILTQKLSPYFDAAIEQESSATAAATAVNSNVSTSSSTDPTGPMRKGIGLPSSQKPGVAQHPAPQAATAAAMMSMSSSSASSTAGFTSTNLRKPPSLSTLAMPSFSGMRPASHNLISALRSLISALPRENRDLLRTIVELIQATARESKMTKMPLSNLLVVFLPSLNISMPLLKVLCEEERVWAGLLGEGEGEGEGAGGAVVDVTTVVLDIRREGEGEEEATGDGQQHEEEHEEDEEEDEDEDEDDIDAQRRWTVVQRKEVPTVYLDSRSQASSVSLASSAQVSSSRDPSVLSRTESSIMSSDRHEEGDVVLSSSVESVPTPLTSSAQSSQAYLSLDNAKYGLSSRDRAEPRVQVFEPTSPSLEIGMPSGMDNGVVDKEESQARKFAISSPLPYKLSPTPPPKMENNDPSPSPTSPTNPRRRSIPALSFPSLFTGGHSHRGSHGSFGSHGSEPASPAESMASAASGKPQPSGTLRAKKPSLKLLFSSSKKSCGSLKDVIAVTTPGSAGTHSINSHHQQPYQARTASMVLAVSADGNSCSSDSSVSTPLSAVTAPGTAVSSSFSYDERGSGGAGLDFPPVLGTPIEQGPSLRSELGLETSPPTTATLGNKKQKKERIKTMVGQTPIADWYSTKSAASSVVDLPVPVNRSQRELSDVGTVEMGGSSFSRAEYNEDDEDEYDVESRRRTVIGRTRGISVSSHQSTNHLGLDVEEFGGEDDWTKTVLLAADFELGRA